MSADSKPETFTQEQLQDAAAQEQAELQASEVEHYKQRVVILRANVQRLLVKNAELEAQLAGIEKPIPPAAKKKVAARRS